MLRAPQLLKTRATLETEESWHIQNRGIAVRAITRSEEHNSWTSALGPPDNSQTLLVTVLLD